jgi:hypothetical protein
MPSKEIDIPKFGGPAKEVGGSRPPPVDSEIPGCSTANSTQEETPMATEPKNGKNGAGQFTKGTSGNPGGRPPGSRNRATLLMETLLEGEAEQLTRKAIELALAGDLNALRLCLDRLLPPSKDRLISLL